MSAPQKLAETLAACHNLEDGELLLLLRDSGPDTREFLRQQAQAQAQAFYGRQVFIRGLIEFTNFCKNDCYYCGIRRSNPQVQRYRLSQEQILACCQAGYGLGFRTFVLQGGEDPAMTDDWVMEMVQAIRAGFPDCAITLSLGEKKYDTLKRWKEAGADRYLLRHETADACHYASLHPAEMSFEHRMQCLRDLKALGYQTGCGFMVGSPHQTARCLARDMRFIEELDPEMVGIGPFIPQHDTPFGGEAAGTLEETLFLLGLLRLLKPKVLLPATTALGTIHPMGRELGILAGGNVVMPNLSPVGVRAKYMLYDNKICTGDEAAECINCMKRRMESIGYEVVIDRGDYKG